MTAGEIVKAVEQCPLPEGYGYVGMEQDGRTMVMLEEYDLGYRFFVGSLVDPEVRVAIVALKGRTADDLCSLIKAAVSVLGTMEASARSRWN